MAFPKRRIDPEIVRLLCWLLLMPGLALWPILSALPFFSLVGGDLSLTTASVNVAFMLSGFWPLLAVYVGYGALSGGLPPRPGPGSALGTLVGLYATVWTALYGVFLLVGR